MKLNDTAWKRRFIAAAFGWAAAAASPSFAEEKYAPPSSALPVSGYVSEDKAALITYKADPDFVIKLDEGVNTDSAAKIRAKLYELARKDPNKDIVMEINSGGGTVTQGYAILDAIHSIPNKVHTVCYRAESMGAVILISNMSGNRYAYPHCRIMLHEPSTDVKSNTSGMIQVARDLDDMREEFTRLISRASGLDASVVREFVSSGDTIINADQAYKLNFIDGILPERLKAERVGKEPKLSEDFCTPDRKRRMSLCTPAGVAASQALSPHAANMFQPK